MVCRVRFFKTTNVLQCPLFGTTNGLQSASLIFCSVLDCSYNFQRNIFNTDYGKDLIVTIDKGQISMFENGQHLITDICMHLFDCHTHVVFQITTVLFLSLTSPSHILIMVNPLLIYLHTNLSLTMPNFGWHDMISLNCLNSTFLSFHFMSNCQHLALSHIQC